MLRYKADFARDNVNTFLLKDYNSLKSKIEQSILDESNKGNTEVSIQFNSSLVDEDMLVLEVTESGYECQVIDVYLDNQNHNDKEITISWANALVEDAENI